LQDVGDAKAGLKGVGGGGVAEVMGEDALADQAGDAAEEDAGGDQPGEIRAVADVARFAVGRGGRRGSGSGGWRFVIGSDDATSPGRLDAGSIATRERAL
jgi:hypothetical protein